MRSPVPIVKEKLADVAATLGYSIQKATRFDEAAERRLYVELFGHHAVQEKLFFNLGAGSFRHPCWTNVDNPSQYYAKAQQGGVHLSWDAMSAQSVPIPDSTAHIVYCSHMIEHLPDESARHLVQEAWRCLRPGGIFRITTIDVDKDYRAFKANDRRYFDWIDMYSKPDEMRRACIRKPLREASIHQIFLFHFASSASELHSDGAPNPISDAELTRAFASMRYEEALDFCSARCSVDVQRRHPGNHISWWNGARLVALMQHAGFTEVYLSGQGQSVSPALRDRRFFDVTRPTKSVFAEARK